MSKRAEHTKAPWFIREYINGNGQACCEITCNRNTQIIADIPDYCFYDNEKRNNKANARLIASAPDLLEALEQAVTSMQDRGYPNSHLAVRAAREAIAKARGADHEQIA